MWNIHKLNEYREKRYQQRNVIKSIYAVEFDVSSNHCCEQHCNIVVAPDLCVMMSLYKKLCLPVIKIIKNIHQSNLYQLYTIIYTWQRLFVASFNGL